MLQIQENIYDTYQVLSRSLLYDTFCTPFSWFCLTLNKVPDRIVRHVCFTFTCTPTSQRPSTLGSNEVCVGRWNCHRLFVTSPTPPGILPGVAVKMQGFKDTVR
jgi:hypothetical protein